MPRADLPIIPLPRSAELGEGRLGVGGRQWRAHQAALGVPAISHKLAQLGAELQGDAKLNEFEVAVGEPQAKPPMVARPGGYGLHIDAKGLALRGADADGLFWGLVTVEQLLESGRSLPAVRIADWPEVAIRYHHDDISRKQVSKLADFKRIIRSLSSFKISHYTLYIEDVLHLRSFPDIGEGRGKLTNDEVAAIVREGELHRVEVFPTLQLLGHHENLLAKPKYAHLGRKVFQPMSSLDPSKPETRAFLEKVIDDACALFPSKWFHMGFDETQGVDGEAFVAHANWCAERLVERGKTPVMWADMFTHWGVGRVQDLHPAIVPCNWQYGSQQPIPHQAELEAQGRPIWGLAGYSNWCAFLPDSEAAKDHFTVWSRAFAGRERAALGSSQWGDDGYENHRDASWHLFAAFAEAAWSGPAADRASLDSRFQRAFYGAELPEVARVLAELPRALSESPGASWRVHRRPADAMLRDAAADPKLAQHAAEDEARLDAALAAVERSRPLARREVEHLDHLVVSIERMRSVARRRRFAQRRLDDPVAAAREAPALAADIRRVRDRYQEAWLRHNKPENVEVSLAVFEQAAAQIERVAAGTQADNGVRWAPLDLDALFDVRVPGVSGVPVGLAAIEGVPYRFAPLDRTHAHLPLSRGTVRAAFAATPVRDLRLVVSAPKPKDERAAPALRVELTRGGVTIFSEELRLIDHLVDWWAPLGEHMWAGGGLAHADRSRVDWLLSPGDKYGLCVVRGFAIPAGLEADGLALTPLIDTDLVLFAGTIERA